MDPGPSSTYSPDHPRTARPRAQQPSSPEQQIPADDNTVPLSRRSSPLHKLPAPTPRSGPLPHFLDNHAARRSLPASPSRTRTPKKTPKPSTPHALVMSAAENAAAVGSLGEARPLNVSDALGYLDAVKLQFQDKPDVYNHFLDIMKDFKSQVIDTPGVIERVSMLFHGNPVLIHGFNTFLPPGYRIELNTDHTDTITVTTPNGQMTQRTTMYGIPSSLGREPILAPGVIPQYPQPPFLAAPPVLPVGIGNGSRPVSPAPIHPHAPPQVSHEMQGVRAPHPQSPALQGGGDLAAILGSLSNNGTRQTQRSQNGEFHHAINYLSKIKNRYHDDPETYKQFLEILQTYQKEQRHINDQSQVYAQVQMLFKDAPDLMDEFKDFLPEAVPPVHPAGLVGILPQPATGPGVLVSLAQSEPPAVDKTMKPQNRRRKRPPEKEPPAPQKAGGRAAKRAKTSRAEPASPKFSPYQAPHSPQPISMHVHPVSTPMHQPGMPPHPVRQASAGPVGSMAQDEFMFFDRAKKALENGGTYEEFLKLLHLFSRDIIDAVTLVNRVEVFLGDDLLAQFKALLGWEEHIGHNDGPPGSLRSGPPDYYTARPPDDGHGPSYRRLPDSEVRIACSGRDRLCWSVLNDEWVSHPTWASEDAGFMTHKKNSFEDTLHKSEEERHEYQVQIEALTRTIAVLDPLESRIEGMSAEERANFRLKANLGGESRAIYERIIKKIYGYDPGNEVLRAIQETPTTAIPVVLARLRKKDDEWRRAQREWNRTWREIDGKNFYKALDHQGIAFKQNDKKNITAKHFVLEIESAKAAQLTARDGSRAGGASNSSGSSRSPAANPATRPLGYQLQYQLEDVRVLHDAVKLIFTFLDHSPQQFSPPERRGIEKFVRSFVPMLFMFPPQEFDKSCGPLAPGPDDEPSEDRSASVNDDEHPKSTARNLKEHEGVSAQDLRTRLLKTAQESAQGVQDGSSSLLTDSTTFGALDSPQNASNANAPRTEDGLGPSLPELRTNAEDIWVKELKVGGVHCAGETPLVRRPFFAGTTFYTWLRLVQLLYSRLLICKEIGAQMAAEKHASLRANPVAAKLGLDDSNGPSAVLEQAQAAFRGRPQDDEQPNLLYLYLLDACEKMFENELDQATFEEHMRWFFRTKAYNVFTLDRVIGAIIKQVQTVLGDNKCQELWYLLQQSRSAEKATAMTTHDLIRYRREAERNVGADEKLYRFDWDVASKSLRVQLMGPEDPSVDEDESASGRWRAYVASYVMVHPSEWLPSSSGYAAVFLKRNVHELGEDGKDGVVEDQRGLGVHIQERTYKLMYERGKEDMLWRRRRDDGDRLLRGRAVVREEERRRRARRLFERMIRY